MIFDTIEKNHGISFKELKRTYLPTINSLDNINSQNCLIL